MTIDAMGCQRAIARKIVDAGAHYVLAVKANHKFPLARIRLAHEAIDRMSPEKRGELVSEHREIGKDHGRIETRHCVAFEWKALGEPSPWPYARSAAIIEATREIGDTVTTERRYYFSTLPADATRIANAVRSHWAIENGMHWCLDVAFGEDQCRVRIDNAAQNFAVLRRISMNLLRQDRTSKVGLKTRRLKACANDNYLARILGWPDSPTI